MAKNDSDRKWVKVNPEVLGTLVNNVICSPDFLDTWEGMGEIGIGSSWKSLTTVCDLLRKSEYHRQILFDGMGKIVDAACNCEDGDDFTKFELEIGSQLLTIGGIYLILGVIISFALRAPMRDPPAEG
jgi:hypothetical protein